MASVSGSESASASNIEAVVKSRKNATGARDDPAWAHGYEVSRERLKIKCKNYDKIVSRGPYRLKHHLGYTKINVAPCPAVPDDVKNNMLAISAYPLIKVFRMVDSDEKPAMGFIYSEMEKAKQKIKTNFKDDRKSYDLIWEIIDERWEVQLHKPLHDAAYYLNPQLHFSSEFRANREVMLGLYTVMDRMLDDEERDKLKDKKIRKQVNLQVDDISSDDEWIVEKETENTVTLSYNFNLRSLGRGDDGDEESGCIQIGDEHAENMRTQEHSTVDDLELPEEDEFEILYDDDVGDDEELNEI
ncbi:hypothetical protein CRG98_004396 [Punica granatum]|uniref:BED-type domain-containing protein n=1 Tax=Punica granatum TaxID=22663 RepID=A0A2I0L3F5_PUNGR|nr:hypothetical protein CRG98_004396 [Punica granatum]